VRRGIWRGRGGKVDDKDMGCRKGSGKEEGNGRKK
jgi:hypothetical protein